MSGADEVRNAIRSRGKVTLSLVVVNVAVFIVLSLMGNTESAAFMAAHGACYAPYIVENGEYWRLFTAMFLHFGVVHLLYNMLCLLTLGDLLEKVIGPVRYLVIYVAGGLAGNVLSVLVGMRTHNYAVSAGASGAAFAVIGALLLVVIRRHGRLGQIRLERMLLMVALMIAQGFVEPGTDNMAHIGGVIAGFVLAFVLGAG
ncbi:MAG: rhomboid family intramembrane serine protease [Lachnospiraceae bacterium]|nr:rhomboid family intramembrane serine protease [Lachnospiraceae bacterium]